MILNDATDDPVQASPVDLSGATIKFIMRDTSGTVVVEATLAGTELVDLPNGSIRYEWVAADTDTVGDFYVEIEVTDSDSFITTYWDLRTAQEVADDEPPVPFIITIVDDFA
jgi:hypothetical protein